MAVIGHATTAPDHESPDTRRETYRTTFGQPPDVDLTIELSADAVLVERGHVGRTGVFLFQAQGLTLVTSSLPALLASVECRINHGSAIHYLAYGIPAPGRSLVDGILELPAGHSVRLTPRSPPVRARSFELFSNSEPRNPDADGIDAIAAAVDAAIERSCEGSRSPALLLSAGVDSSYMAAVLGERVTGCYTSHFPDLDRPGEYEDARRFSQATGHAHHAVPIRIADARAGLDHVLGAQEPKSAWSTIVHDRICRAAGANGHDMLLSGLGADEVFGGYFQYVQSFRKVWQQALRVDPTDTRNPLDVVLQSPQFYRGRVFTGVPSFFDARSLREALLPRWRQWDRYQDSAQFYRDALWRKPDLHLFEAMIAHEMQHRVPDLLIRGFETFSRAHGLASGYPFLAPEVARMGAALGAEHRFRPDPATGATRNKLLWREIAGRRLPEFVMSRPPSTYDAPIHDWFADSGFLDTICDAIKLPSFRDLGLLSGAWIDGFVDTLRRLRGSPNPIENAHLTEQAWALATLSAWQDRTLDVR